MFPCILLSRVFNIEANFKFLYQGFIPQMIVNEMKNNYKDSILEGTVLTMDKSKSPVQAAID